ncbi:aldo-keto reductase family protein [Streptomyces mirabilis]|uniref:hypothetical protein n=1 Tax=Streptomyces mirabilis TaxID=68239 RepID=UPI003663327E
MTAQLALGTYRCQAIPEAAARAAASGAWIDTVPNYHAGRAQALLAPVLAAHPSLNVSTKTGYFTAATGIDAVSAGVLTEDQARAGHSLAPDYVRWQTGRSASGWTRPRCTTRSGPTPATVPPCTARCGTRSWSWRKPWRPGMCPGTGSPRGRAWRRRRSRWGSCSPWPPKPLAAGTTWPRSSCRSAW